MTVAEYVALVQRERSAHSRLARVLRNFGNGASLEQVYVAWQTWSELAANVERAKRDALDGDAPF